MDRTTFKRLFGFFCLAGLLMLTTAGSLNLRGQTAIQRAETFFGSDPIDERDASLGRPPGFTQTYETPAHFEPDHGGICIILRGHHQSYVTAVALADSIFNGTIAESSWSAGAQVRLTICVDPEATETVRSGTELTIAEAQAIAARTGIYELAATTSSSDRFVTRGVISGARPVYGSITGISSKYFDALAGGFQTWALDTANVPTFRTIAYAGDSYPGEGIGNCLWRNGYFQAFGRARSVQDQRVNHDSTQTQPEAGYNYWLYPSAVMGYGAVGRGVGFHGIGEQVSRWNYGGRVWEDAAGGNDAGAVPDSVFKWLDMAIHTPSVGCLIFDGAINAAATGSDISYANFRHILFRAARRMLEHGPDQQPLLRTYTAEQLARYARGIRIGNLFNTHNFLVLTDSTAAVDTTKRYTSYGITKSTLGRSQSGATPFLKNKVPINFSMSDEHFSGSTADTFRTPGNLDSVLIGGVGGGPRPIVINLARNKYSVDSVKASWSSTDSSYGLSCDSCNVIMEGFNDDDEGRPLNFCVVTMGSAASEIRVAVQYMVHSNVTFDGADSLYLAYKAFQFSERWDDHMNEGPSSYQLMSLFACFPQAVQLPDTTMLPANTDSSGWGRMFPWKQRVRPQFLQSLWAADTTNIMGKLYGTTLNWYDHQWPRGTCELNPSMVNSVADAEDYDYRNTLGNSRSLVVAAMPNHETFAADQTRLNAKGQIFTTQFTVDINERTDYVKCVISVTPLVGTALLSPFPVVTYLDISAWGMD